MSFRRLRSVIRVIVLGASFAVGAVTALAAGSVFDLSSGFSAGANPNPPWSYGWVTNLGGPFTALQVPIISGADGGLPIPSWQLTGSETPAVYRNSNTNTVSVGGGAAQFPPGTVWFIPGENGRPENFGVIRFTVPAGGAGTYQVQLSVAPIYPGPPQGDTDFHVAKNGVELFGQFLAPQASASYSNSLSLAEGDAVDFVIGRGADGSQFASGLRIEASLTADTIVPEAPKIISQPQSQTVTAGSNVTFTVVAEGTGPLGYQWRRDGADIAGATNDSLTLESVQSTDVGGYSVRVSNDLGSVLSGAATLTVIVPPPPGNYDANRDFSLASNPNGVWTYGALPEIGGSFTPLAAPHVQLAGNGVEVRSWELVLYSEPAVFCNTSAQTASGGPGSYPPGTIWFFAGYPGSGHNLGAIRFTLPAGEAGNYRIEAAVQHYLDGPPAGDTDFHVAKNSSELFGQFLAPGDRSGYTNTLALVPGDTIDFLVGRGADDQLYASGLKIAARITRTDVTDLPPLIISQPQSQTVAVGANVTFSVAAEGAGPLGYQWRFNGADLADATNTTLTLDNIQSTAAGSYSVQVSNINGSVLSGAATLTVIVPPPPGNYDANRDFSLASNPNGVWTYGVLPEIGGSFTPLAAPHVQLAGNGVEVRSWELVLYSEPAVFCNTSAQTASGGPGSYPPGTIWFFAGYPGSGHNLGAIRFTLPAGEAGNYRIEAAVQHYLDGPPAGDTDFHVAKNSSELFGQFLAPGDRSGYTNTLALVPGDTIDFLVGRGADDQLYASGLKIAARITRTDVTDLPPLIISQPQSQTVAVGANVTFSVAAEGAGPLVYQWRFNGADLADATNTTLTLDNIQSTAAGSYSVQVSNPNGSVLSGAATLTVIVPPPPGNYDANRDFSLASNPNGVWTYGAVPEIGGPFTRLAAPHVQLAGNGVEVRSWELVLYSEPAVFCNTSVQTASGGPGSYPPGTIWFFAGYPGSGHNLGAIRFTLPAGEAGNYRIEAAVQHYLDVPPAGDTDFHVAKNSSELFGQFMAPGDRSGYTNTLALVPGDTIDFLVGRGADDQLYASGLKIAARITRTDATDLPPLIISQPQSQTVAVGANVTFSVTAEGTGPLEYQWRFKGADLADATNATLTLDSAQVADAGKYSVRISNSFVSVSSGEAMLKVITPPPIGSYDLSRDFSPTDNPGGAWSFGWSGSVGGPFTLLTVPHASWANGVSIPSWQLTSYQTPAVYQNNSTTTVSVAEGQGVFPPGAVWYYPGEDGRSENFGVIRFTVPPGAAGAYRLETAVRSVYDGALSRDTDFHVVKTGAEIFSRFLPPNSGTGYTNILALSVGDTVDFVIGRGEDGSQYASGLKIHATLLLDGAVTEVPPLITAQPQSQSVVAGASVTFSVAIEGTSPFTYQWRLDGANLADATNASLTLDNVQSADAGSYSVRVSNPVGTTLSATASLTVTPTDVPPFIIQQPASRVAAPGETVIFAVVSGGTAPLSYQWRREGMNLPGANSDRLVLSGVFLINSGLYSVVVSNSFGVVTSANALLTVNDYGVSGSVNFANRFGSLNAPIFDVDGVTKLSGQNFRAQLYAGTTIAGLAPVGPSVGFSGGGLFHGGTRNIHDVAPGLSAYVQVRVWDEFSGTNYDLALSAGGKTGASAIFSVVTGGGGAPPAFPATLTGLQSFSLMQAAAASPLIAPIIRPGAPLPDGTPTWLLTGQMGSSYLIECSTNLHAWLPLVTVFNPSGTVEFTDPAFATTPCTFYRARLVE